MKIFTWKLAGRSAGCRIIQAKGRFSFTGCNIISVIPYGMINQWLFPSADSSCQLFLISFEVHNCWFGVFLVLFINNETFANNLYFFTSSLYCKFVYCCVGQGANEGDLKLLQNVGSVFSNHLALSYLLLFPYESAVLPLVTQVLWRTTLAVPWHRSLAKLLRQVSPQHLCPEKRRAVLVWSLNGIGCHFHCTQCGSLPLGHTQGRANTSHVVVQYQDRRLRTPVSLAQLVLRGYGKMRGRLEVTANFSYSIRKKPNFSNCGWICNKTGRESKSVEGIQ